MKFNILYTLFFSVLTETVLGDPSCPQPISKSDSGYNALMLYLMRDEITDSQYYYPFNSTNAKFGHWYYNL